MTPHHPLPAQVCPSPTEGGHLLDLDVEEGVTAFAYTPDERVGSSIVLEPAAWARFCELAGLSLDDSPTEDA